MVVKAGLASTVIAKVALQARRSMFGSRAAAFSDYHLTGKITCPRCGRHYVGTNAIGRSRVYCYYCCTTCSKHGVAHCPDLASTPTSSTRRSWSPWPRSASSTYHEHAASARAVP